MLKLGVWCHLDKDSYKESGGRCDGSIYPSTTALSHSIVRANHIYAPKSAILKAHATKWSYSATPPSRSTNAIAFFEYRHSLNATCLERLLNSIICTSDSDLSSTLRRSSVELICCTPKQLLLLLYQLLLGEPTLLDLALLLLAILSSRQ